jgi:hypothetical protein
MNQEFFVKQIKEIVDRYSKMDDDDAVGLDTMNISLQEEAAISLFAVVERLTIRNSIYYLNAERHFKSWVDFDDYESRRYALKSLYGITKGLARDYKGGYIRKIEELIHAELFSDFLEMAEYLLDKGYKDSSAVLIGGVLEEHLRKLCLKNNITIEENDKPKRAQRLNQDLRSKNVFDKGDQKLITSLLDLRNNSAHANYDKYVDKDVGLMLHGVRNLISKFSV